MTGTKTWPPDWWRAMGPTTLFVSVFLWLGTLTALADQAAPSAPPEEKVEVKTATGEVTHLSTRAISVEVDRTAEHSTELLLPLGEEVALSHLRSLQELKRGDTVKVRYETTSQRQDDGRWAVVKTAATQVSLIRRAPEQALGSREETVR